MKDQAWCSKRPDWYGLQRLLMKLADRSIIAMIVLGILTFILWPISAVLLKSVRSEGAWTLQLYSEMFAGNLQLIANSIFVACGSTLLALIVSLAIALYERNASPRAKKITLSLLLLTMISPPFLSSLAYITLFGRRGIITNTLLGMNVNPYGWHGIVAMQALGEISFTALLLIGAMRGLDQALIQASRDLGASGWATLRRVIFPLLLPGLSAAAFIAFIKSLADFGTPIVVGGNFNVLATEAYLMVIARGDLAKAAVLSVFILGPALLCAFFYNWTGAKKTFSASGTLKIEGEGGLDLPRPLRLCLAAVSWSFFALMLLQFAAIVFTAFSRYNAGGYVFTLEYLAEFGTDKYGSIFRSICYAFFAGVVASLIGVLLAYYVERRKIWGGKLIEFIASLPYVVPGTFFGIGYVLAFNGDPLPLTGTAAIVVLNCVFRQVTVAAKTGFAVLQGVSPDLENAAKDLGSPPLAVLREIMLPLLKPALLLSFVNTFTTTMMTIGSIIFIISPGAKVATVELFGLLNQGEYGKAAVLATLLTVITVAANMIFARLLLGKKSEEEIVQDVS